jgi:hypothetical protein
VYGILYLSLASFPVEFQQIRGWDALVGHLPFLSILAGMNLGATINLLNQKFYFKQFQTNENKAVPEVRLPPMMLGSIFLLQACLYSAGQVLRRYSGSVQLLERLQWDWDFYHLSVGLNYLVDTFTRFSASAVAVNIFPRSNFWWHVSAFCYYLVLSHGSSLGIEFAWICDNCSRSNPICVICLRTW